MKKKWTTLLMLCLAFTMLFSSSVFAFSDLKGYKEADKIYHLQNKKIINGIDKTKYAPQSKVSYGTAAVLLVKAFDLNIDHIRFIKEPKASDYFKHAADNAWYSQALIVAHLNGIPLPKDMKPSSHVTREEFAHYIMTALDRKGSFAFTKMYFHFEDSDQLNPEYAGSIQNLLNGKIISLDDKQNLRPKDKITRYEAGIMIYNALELIENQTNHEEPAQVDETVTLEVVKVTDKVNKVVISWGEKPHPGYNISIDKITFVDNKAVVYYKLHLPLPEVMYPMVITYPQAETYVDASFEVAIQQIK